jgi:hypothetical protein
MACSDDVSRVAKVGLKDADHRGGISRDLYDVSVRNSSEAKASLVFADFMYGLNRLRKNSIRREAEVSTPA